MGRIFAADIARHAPGATLVLTGRRELDDAGRQQLRELEAMGATATYHAIDASDRSAVRQALLQIREDHGTLDGILHSAGVIQDSLLLRKTEEQIRAVLSAKVNGLDAIAGRESRQLRLILLERGSARVRIALCDSGPGFAEAILPSLFTPFTSSKEVGLGLGLTICRSLLARCDAGILLGSALGGGAMVVLEFGDPPSAKPQEGAESEVFLNEEKSVDVVTP